MFNPQGNVDREQRVICALTSVCDGDSHPTDLGYRVIAAGVLAQLVQPLNPQSRCRRRAFGSMGAAMGSGT